jgi:hypothetical protein
MYINAKMILVETSRNPERGNEGEKFKGGIQV